MPTVHLRIKGRVQGVFYRATAKEMADKFGIKGWIKNTGNNDVEATVTGSDEAIEKFIEWCRKGPKKAIVDEVIIASQEETSFKDFSVIR
jgi:acylphosphatase